MAGYYTGLKTMLLPPSGMSVEVANTFYSPSKWFCDVELDIRSQTWTGLHTDPNGDPVTIIRYDPLGFFMKGGGGNSERVKGNVYSRYPLWGYYYYATDSETTAALSVTFSRETISDAGAHVPGVYPAGSEDSFLRLYIPAGTATTQVAEQPYIPQELHASASCYGTDAAGHPPPITTYGLDLTFAAQYPYPDADGGQYTGSFFSPERPTPYDIYSYPATYLDGHITFSVAGIYSTLEMDGAVFTLYGIWQPPVAYGTVPHPIVFYFPAVTRHLVVGSVLYPGTNPPAGTSPALLGRPSRHYNRACNGPIPNSAVSQGVEFWRSDRPVPYIQPGAIQPPTIWDTGPVRVTRLIGDNSPRLAQDSRSLLYIIYNNPATGAVMKRSDDDGATWNTPTLAIPGGRHPNIISGGGRTLAAAVTGSGATMHITGVYRGPGDAAFGTAFTFNVSTTGSAGTPLLVADDSFGLAFAAEGPDRIVMHVLLAADAATSDWWSANNGATWTRIPLV